jgi:hypothetical protein
VRLCVQLSIAVAEPFAGTPSRSFPPPFSLPRHSIGRVKPEPATDHDGLGNGRLTAGISAEAKPSMSKHPKSAVAVPTVLMMEDFGRFGPAETPDPDTEITDEIFDEMYAEENAGA